MTSQKRKHLIIVMILILLLSNYNKKNFVEIPIKCNKYFQKYS